MNYVDELEVMSVGAVYDRAFYRINEMRAVTDRAYSGLV